MDETLNEIQSKPVPLVAMIETSQSSMWDKFMHKVSNLF